NRAQHIMPFPRSSKVRRRISPLRPDSESANNSLKRSLQERRARSIGHARQLVDFLGFVLLTNSTTLYLSGRTPASGDPPDARAA
ncbi:MAG: hypothetical protein ACJ76P_03825, partial [Actinomycetota bacterium]